MHSFYYWFYKNYWRLFLALFAVTFFLPWAAGALREPTTIGTLLVIYFGLFYFVQKQRLADRRLAAELMMHFSERLTALQPRIQAIHREGDAGEFLPEQRDDLTAYFNWCGQLYFYYRRHLIATELWESWLNHMRIYYYNPRIRRAWDDELKRDIYYGFDLQLLK